MIVLHSRKEIFEQTVVNFPALGMILHANYERLAGESHLLDDVIGIAPGFDHEPFSCSIDCLVM